MIALVLKGLIPGLDLQGLSAVVDPKGRVTYTEFST